MSTKEKRKLIEGSITKESGFTGQPVRTHSGQFDKLPRESLIKVKLLHEDPRNNQPGNEPKYPIFQKVDNLTKVLPKNGEYW